MKKFIRLLIFLLSLLIIFFSSFITLYFTLVLFSYINIIRMQYCVSIVKNFHQISEPKIFYAIHEHYKFEIFYHKLLITFNNIVYI